MLGFLDSHVLMDLVGRKNKDIKLWEKKLIILIYLMWILTIIKLILICYVLK